MTDPSIKQDSSTSFVRGFSSGVFHLAISAPYILFIMRADSFLDSAVLRSRQEQHPRSATEPHKKKALWVALGKAN